jgi:O-antigen/teichoic acid export membrane protein
LNKYLKAISYNLIFFALSTLAFLILTPLAIRIMGNEFFGLWSIIFAIAQFTNIGTLGIGSIVNKFASENNCTEAASFRQL